MIESVQSIDKGIATLLAASVAAISSIVSLYISFSLSKRQEKLKNELEQQRSVDKESREFKLKQLTEFYDPIFTRLTANKNIFERIGPTSEARNLNLFNDEETAKVWGKLSSQVIIPNNNDIVMTIQTKLHLLSDSDDDFTYLEFITHAKAYKIFKENAYEAYKLFPYPPTILNSVIKERTKLREEILGNYKLK